MSEEKPKSSLHEMMSALYAMERIHDESPEITDEMVKEHFDAIASVNEKVDRLLGFMDSCQANENIYLKKIEDFEKKAKYFANTYKRLEDYCLFLLRTYPDIEFRGTEAQFVKRVNPPSLKIPIASKASLSNVVSPELAVGIAPEYLLEPKVVWLLNTKRIKDDLLAGKEVPFASLSASEKLVIKPKLIGEK